MPVNRAPSDHQVGVNLSCRKIMQIHNYKPCCATRRAVAYFCFPKLETGAAWPGKIQPLNSSILHTATKISMKDKTVKSMCQYCILRYMSACCRRFHVPPVCLAWWGQDWEHSCESVNSHMLLLQNWLAERETAGQRTSQCMKLTWAKPACSRCKPRIALHCRVK